MLSLFLNVAHSPLPQKQQKNTMTKRREFMVRKALGMACKNFRESMGYSQEKFALLIGMDRTYYASVEAGKRNVSIQNIYKIACGYQIKISVLFEEAEKYIAGGN